MAVQATNSFDAIALSVFRNFVRSAVIIDDEWPAEVPASFMPDRVDFDTPATTCADSDARALSSPLIAKDDVVTSDGNPAALLVAGGPGIGGDASTSTPNAHSGVDPLTAALVDDGAVLEAPDAGEPVVPPHKSIESSDDSLVAMRDAMIQEGVLSTGLRYTDSDQRELALALARRADIVILDWHLVSDDGREAIEILRALMNSGLRFVCIFTGHGRPAEIRRVITETLLPSQGLADEPDFRLGNLVIAIRAKPTFGAVAPVEPAELFSVALDALSRSYHGLIQLGLLELTARHREQLPFILDRFDSALDLAFIVESADTLSPVGPGGAFLGLLIDEWRAHLLGIEADVLSSAGIAAFVRALAERLHGLDLRLLLPRLLDSGIDRELVEALESWAEGDRAGALLAWLDNGACADDVPGPPGRSFPKKKRALVALAILMALRGDAADDKDDVVDSLLRLDALFHQRRDLPPRLSQGTVLEADGKYLVCTTPLCDAIRPKNILNVYSFVEAEVIPMPSPQLLFGHSYCILEVKGRTSCLKVPMRPVVSMRIDSPDIVWVKESSSYQPIIASPWIGLALKARVSDIDIELQPVAQLRVDHALALSSQVASLASRIGIDRVEAVRSNLSPPET